MSSEELPGAGATLGSGLIGPCDVSVVVPVGGDAPAWGRCLEGLARLDPPPGEIIAVIDGPGTDPCPEAAAIGATLVVLDERVGPAGARNRGADVASGELLFFVDSDVELPPGIVARLVSLFSSLGGVSAVIGSYDDEPGDRGFLSQYRNLLHHWVHQHGRERASTFWGACGAVRRSAFLELGGFDEDYAIPCVEDIELGARLRRAGHEIRLVKDLQVKHLKRWRPGNMLVTDLLRRAVPWTELMLSDGRLLNDLNVKSRDRVSVSLAWLLPITLCSALVWPRLLGVAVAAALLLVVANADLFVFYARKRGVLFSLGAIPWYWLYLLICGLGFALGIIRHRLRELAS